MVVHEYKYKESGNSTDCSSYKIYKVGDSLTNGSAWYTLEEGNKSIDDGAKYSLRREIAWKTVAHDIIVKRVIILIILCNVLIIIIWKIQEVFTFLIWNDHFFKLKSHFFANCSALFTGWPLQPFLTVTCLYTVTIVFTPS